MSTDTIEIPLSRIPMTPQLMAELFWSWDDEDQARFFGHLGACALSTPAPWTNELGTFAGLDSQMYGAAGADCMTPLGARVMEIIGEAVSGQRLQAYKIENEPKTMNHIEGNQDL